MSLVGACLFRVVWLTTVFNYVFDHSGPAAGLKSIYLSYPISWGLTALIHLACSLVILHGIIKRKRRREAELLMQNTP